MAWTVARGAAIGFAMVLLTLVGSAVVSLLNIHRLHEEDAWVAHTHQVLTDLESLVSTLKDAETGQRGYLITLDESYLEPYRKALGELGHRRAELRQLIADNQPQAERLQSLDPIIDRRMEVLERNIKIRQTDKFDAVQQAVIEGGGKQMMDEIRRRVDDIENTERSLLSDRREQAHRSYVVAVVACLLALIISATVMAAAWYLIRRELRGRVEATRLANAQKQRLLTTLTSIGDGVIVCDPAGRVTLMNPVAQQLTGWGIEAFGQPLAVVFNIVNEITRAAVENPVTVVLRKGMTVGLANHTLLIAKDGIEHPIDDSGAPIRDEEGKIIGVVLVFRDITERRAIELAEQHRAEELREADRSKDRFLATLAHELRNPLAPISNALELWPMMEKNPAEMEKLRQMMERQVQHMIRLIDDLLDVSRITRGKIQLRLQPVEVATIIDGALESISSFIQKSESHVEIDLPKEPLFVNGDVVRLLQVLSNVLHNAAKYSGRNANISIAAYCEKNEAVIRIRDNGPGIPADMLPHIFDMFTQVDQTLDRAHGGLGIGLTLAKNFVELHGGTITAHSQESQGSEFIIRLPALEASTVPAGSRDAGDGRANDRNLSRHRVLVVDDVQASAKTLALMLKAVGQDVEMRNDGQSAIEAAALWRPSVIFLDIGMPQMDGYEVARRLRQMPEMANVKLVALTGYGQDEDRRRALQAGFNHHLVKPASIEAIEQLLASAPSQRE